MIGRTFHGAQQRRIRLRAKIGTGVFAKEVGCHISHLVRAESGRTQYVSTELVYEFVDALNRLGATVDGRPVTIDDLSSVDPSGCAVCAAREREAQPA